MSTTRLTPSKATREIYNVVIDSSYANSFFYFISTFSRSKTSLVVVKRYLKFESFKIIHMAYIRHFLTKKITLYLLFFDIISKLAFNTFPTSLISHAHDTSIEVRETEAINIFLTFLFKVIDVRCYEVLNVCSKIILFIDLLGLDFIYKAKSTFLIHTYVCFSFRRSSFLFFYNWRKENFSPVFFSNVSAT